MAGCLRIPVGIAAYKNLPMVVKFLAARGAKIELWNRTDKFGWTPLAIAVGYRFGNFKPSPETEAAVREVMIAAGVTPPKTIMPGCSCTLTLFPPLCTIDGMSVRIALDARAVGIDVSISPVIVEMVVLFRPLIFAISAREIG